MELFKIKETWKADKDGETVNKKIEYSFWGVAILFMLASMLLWL